MKKYLLILIMAFGSSSFIKADNEITKSSNNPYKYRLYLSDKNHSPYSLKNPSEFLSEKALLRRKKLKIKVDKHDLPISPFYLKTLREKGLTIVNYSKWGNTVVVAHNDTNLLKNLDKLKFVDSLKCVFIPDGALYSVPKINRRKELKEKIDTTKNYYGRGIKQIEMLNGIKLHNRDFKGQGMTIAIIDGGFHNTDLISGLKNIKILGTKNFVRPNSSVYTELSHGTNVLSCIGTNLPYSFVGTAPEASFYLLESEDGPTENLVEEDNWCAAIEYADSIGVDVVTSSLSYFTFDDERASHKYEDLDGKTALVSRVASLGASRGLLVLVSAGNNGNGYWKKIGFPSDATDVLTVGAVDRYDRNALFSSLGNTSDGRIKPDIMALGVASTIFNINGYLDEANGTSFSTPILCGIVTCLWQAFPNTKPEEIIDAVKMSGDNASHPNNIFGYGTPDMWKAYKILENK